MSTAYRVAFSLVFVLLATMQLLARAFDVRQHLATKTRYAFRMPIPGAPSIYRTPDPEGYEPAHLYLLSRHGTRWPTADRMKQINMLETLFKDCRNTAQHPWIKNWTAPFPGIGYAGGELHSTGADELWGLAYRLRKRFPQLARQEYFPKKFPVVSTQVSRAAASASAFTSAFFPEVPQGPGENPADVFPTPAGSPATSSHSDQDNVLCPSLTDTGPPTDRPQAVAVTMSPKHKDPLLRFFDVCPAYAQHDEYTEQWMSGWMQGNWSRLVPQLEKRLQLQRPMSPCEVESLWQLCLLEAGVYNKIGKACSLFTPEDIKLLEWVDDNHLIETQSYGASINYDIAAPLLHDMLVSLQAAATAHPEAPVARLLFAHCETIVPLATLMGLFEPEDAEPLDLDMDDVSGAATPKTAQADVRAADSLEDLQLVLRRLHSLRSDDTTTCYKGRPSKLPIPDGWHPRLPLSDSRLFKGSRIAPYGANLAMVMYRRVNDSAGSSSHKLRLLYNEQVMPIPGCGGGLDCDLDEFLDLMHDRADPDALSLLCGSASVSRTDSEGSLSPEQVMAELTGGHPRVENQSQGQGQTQW